MIVENVYWYFQSAIDPETCNKIIQFDRKNFFRPGYIGNTSLSLEEIRKIRNSRVKFCDQQWMFDLINPYMVQANENAGWNFQIDWIESVQISRYSSNEFYDWHVDQFSKPYSPIARSKDIGKTNKEKIAPRNKNYIGKIRKLSLTINLTDPTTYKGGRMQFDSPSWTKPTIRECVPARAQGSVVVFPSFVLHKVTPVTEGTRYSLVAWFLGKPFR